MKDLPKIFYPGSKIQIEIVTKTKDNQQYASQVIEAYANGTMEVVTPMLKNKIVYFINDTIITIVLPKGDATYQFDAKVIGKSFANIQTMKVEAISEITKIQRRGYFRLKLIKDIECRAAANMEDREFGEVFKGTMVDISGGGVLFTTTTDIDEYGIIELTIDLNGKKLVVLSSIRRKSLISAGTKVKYTYGVRFENISDFERNLIAKYIFEEQRKLIKKGLV